MWQEGQPCAEEGKGASARTTTTYYQLHLFPATTTITTNYLLPGRVGAAEQGGACEGCPRHARGRRGRRSLHFQVPPAMGAWHELAGAEAIPQRRKSQSSWGASEREKGASPVGYRSVWSRTDPRIILQKYSRRRGKASQQYNEASSLHLGDASARGCRASRTCQRHRCLSATRYVCSHI